MQIEPLTNDDIPAVAALFQSSAREFLADQSDPGALDWFFRDNDEAAFRRYAAHGHTYHVARAGGVVAGFVGVRSETHLFHLFVDKRWHRQGLASHLWDVARETALAAGNPGFFTVNSSPFALPVYTRWGFVPTAPLQCVKGLYFTPMRLELAPPA